MTDHKYIIETLCRRYSLEMLEKQLQRVQNGVPEGAADSFLGKASVDELEKAIAGLMIDHEHDISTLCTCYSLDTLKQRLEKVQDGTAKDGWEEDGIRDVLYESSIQELSEAISCYDEKQFKDIREELEAAMKQYGFI